MIFDNSDEQEFEFEDKHFKSTLKRLVPEGEEDSGYQYIISINRFTEEMIKTFEDNDFSFRD